MRGCFVSIMALSCMVCCAAQDRFYYTGPQLKLSRSQYSCVSVGTFDDASQADRSALAACGDYVLSFQRGGMVTAYKFDGVSLMKASAFKLGSYGTDNGASAVCFGTQYYAKNDKFPLLFVSQSNVDAPQGTNGLIYVERIDNSAKSSKLVAKIQFKDAAKLFNGPLNWTVDAESKYLYGVGTVDAHRHRVMKFRVPTISVKAKTPPTINLAERDMLEAYVIEDYAPSVNINGDFGLMVKYGRMYITAGYRSSLLYVWNLSKRKLQNSIDLEMSAGGGLIDCAEYMGELLVQNQTGVYKLRFE